MTNETNKEPTLAERLGTVRVGARRDLDVSRHLFRGESSYIIRDPVTFDSHRFTPEDYQIFIAIDESRTLEEIFEDVVAKELMAPEDEEAFYQFVFSLHRLNFLSLPVSDDKILFKRYQARLNARRKQKIFGFLFLQIPLINPDAFLDRTVARMRWLYTPWAFILWLILVGSAAYVALSRWDDLLQPVNGLLAARNLFAMWFILIFLKIIHEFGHAYACKCFGGHVPEMGVYMIMFTPCAYVNATTAWSFTKKVHRLVVSLSGVYVEVAVASLAAFVWAATGPSVINSVAYNVMFLASAVTLLFNVNPLMRYDGYYVASDLLEIPNLRARSSKYVVNIAKRWLLGVSVENEPADWKLKTILITFGLAATSYRTMVMCTIAAVVASKFFLLGVGFACFYISTTLFGLLRRLTHYLWRSGETENVRYRAVAVTALLIIGIPVLLGVVPVPGHVYAKAAVTAETEVTVRTSSPGFIRSVEFERNQNVAPGKILAQLEYSELEEQVAQADSMVQASKIRMLAFQSEDPAALRQEAVRAAAAQSELDYFQNKLDDLNIAAPTEGTIVAGIQPTEIGRYLEAGDPVATLVRGRWQARTILTAEEVAGVQPYIGQNVVFRCRSRPDKPHHGQISSFNPGGQRHTDLTALTHLAGGDVVLDQATGETAQPYWEITVTFDDNNEYPIMHGMDGVLQFPTEPEPVGMRAYRGLTRFLNKLMRS